MTRTSLIALVLLWLGLTTAGLYCLGSFESAPGQAAQAPQHIAPQKRTHLLLLAHPRCPCTVATLHELARVLAQLGDKRKEVDVEILFLHAPGMPPEWRHADNVELAQSIPDVRVRFDETGEESRAMGAYTSGQVLVYAADGQLRYAGGITSGRGHEGDNQGADAALAALRGEAPPTPTALVFGCELWNPQTGTTNAPTGDGPKLPGFFPGLKP